MKSEKLIELIRHPEKASSEDLRELDDLVCRYPYFQTARILYLKALYIKAGPRFRNELKLSTVHITDHKQFFRYLNQQIHFEQTGATTALSGLSEIVDERIREINGHIEVSSQGIPAYFQHPANENPSDGEEMVSLNFPKPAYTSSEKNKKLHRIEREDSNVISNPIQLDNIPGVISDYNEEEYLPISAPIPENIPGIPIPDLSGIPGMISEKQPEIPPLPQPGHAPVLAMDLDLEEEPVSPVTSPVSQDTFETPEILSGGYRLPAEHVVAVTPAPEKSQKKNRKKKDELIEQFIQTDPGMPKITATTDTRDLSKENPYAKEELFSETLAKIYVRQHLYEKAIATYIKLSLKYPEKSVYFADRIEKIKENINNQE